VAKAKTAVQMIFIGFILAIPVVMDMNISKGFYDFLANLVSGNAILIIMILVMTFTVYTGVDYYVKFRNELKKLT
jgi:phosphatidylglycerophosphate synthase